MKIFSVIQTSKVALKPNLNIFSKSVPKIDNILPRVEKPVLLYYLQNESDFKTDILKKTVNNQYVFPKEQKTLDIIEALEKKKIITQQAPWESPRFNNGVLNDNAYKDIVDKIAATDTLSTYEKNKYINQLAQANYKSYKPSFQGSSDDIRELGLDSDKVTLDNPNFMSADIKDVDVSLPKHLQNIVDSKDVELLEDNGLEDLLTEMGDTLKSGHDATSFFEKLFDYIL